MKHLNKRLLSLVLAICMVLSLAAPAAAAPAGKVTFTQVDNSAVTAELLTKADDDLHTMSDYVDSDMVRVSIFLEDQSTIMAGYSVDSIAANSQAMAYRAGLKNKQAQVTAAIERKLGQKLDVVWNLTLAANVISANVKFGQIADIEAVSGVSQVLVETCYAPDVVKAGDANTPNMSTSSAQIGSAAAWAAGYTGAGSRIAVIDTGADTDHQSLSADAFQYSLAYQAGKAGMGIEEYVEYIDLLDADEIAALSEQLNAPVGAEAYINSKIPFGYNYIDGDLDITHDNDTQGSHGSHVSGIATANAYLHLGAEQFVNAMDHAMVRGVAPDAQLITMKVFGKAGGAYDSDYMAAIEDAVILGCDAANLSLGSGNPGTSRNATAEYQAIMESLTKAGIVVAMSAGNSGSWVENAYNVGYLYAEDVSMQTNGSPGSFTNSLSVASVDNDGKTGYFFTIGDLMIVYNEMLEGNSGKYSNEPFTTIAGEHEYVFIDGVGTPEDWAAVGDALVGKVAICSRGTTSFFEKATAAVDAGAIATFIYNNQAGVINMDLTDYKYTQPCASLTQADGAAVKAASTPVTDEEGNVLYYTGTMTIGDTLGAGQFNSEFYTMSSFSSWGVPGSLELKPEITAPGGNIYSLNGVDKSGTAYESMSGTSMASPQVAGMAALVAQYIRENGLEQTTGLTARQLAQSLLMSTAEPMLASASGYYSVMQQGAGLANVGAAVTADSYITMADGSNAGAADGKVKVELGDDPNRDGSYSATFTVNNLTGLDKAFDLSADFFIQAPTSDGVNMYMYTATALIGADVSWTVNGQAIEPANMNGMDFNGDGAVNSDDGQAILDYATGVIDSLTNIGKADLDADGDVDSYDAYLFLSELSSGVCMVPANGSAEVTVNFSLSDDWKDTLDYYYPNGTYIQGYIFAESMTDEEGVAGTSHSIPVLGFFGNWTDPSMFDVGNAQVYATGEETRIPYLNDPEVNTFLVTYADEPGAKYVFGGNPLVTDDTYMPERNAINSADMIAGISFAAIRNAAASKFTAVNETTGEILADALPGAVSSAYYYVNGAVWRNTGYTLNTKFDLSSANEGDLISMGLTLAPEYYVDAEGNVNWDAMGEGATFGTTAVIDNTAPVLEDVTLSMFKNTMTVTASDNEYVAAVALYNKAGTEVLTYTGAKQDIAKGETAEYTFSMDGVSGSKFLLQVMDYAMNTTTFVVEMQLGDEVALPDMIAFDLDYGYWTSFSKSSTHNDLEKYTASDVSFIAATTVDHMVLAADDAGNLYVMPENDLADVTLIANTGTLLLDMAYNAADDTVYAVDENGYLVTVDRLNAQVEPIGEIGVLTNTLACDENGTFYCNGFGTGAVYAFTLETLAEPEVLIENVGIKSQYIQAMEIDPNTGMLIWTSYYVRSLLGYTFGYSYLYEIDTEAATYTRYNDMWDELAALIIPVKTEGGSWTAPTETVTGIQLSAESASVLKGSSLKLTANILPWTVVDRSVTWTSDNEAVATVDADGIITGVSAGTAVITATSNLDASFSASCTVTVEALGITVNGTLQDADGNPMFYSWNMETEDTWSAGTAIDTNMTSATYNPVNDRYYIMDANDNSWAMHVVDPATGTSEAVGPNAAGVPLWDMEYSQWLSTEDAAKINAIYYYYFLPGKDPMALDTSAFGLSSYLSQYTGAQYLTAITSAGYYPFPEDDGTITDTELVLMLDNAGYIWYFWIYPTESGFSANLNFVPTDLAIEFPGDDTGNHMYSSMVMGEDGNIYLSAFTGDTNELYRLTLDEAGEMYTATRIGDVGEGVWPATITSVTVNEDDVVNTIPAIGAIDTISTVKVSAEELAGASVNAAPTASFSMDAAARSAKRSAELFSASDVAEDEKTVIIDVTADVAATNGVIDINWDAEALELTEVISLTGNTSVVETADSLTFGYVSMTAIEAGSSIVTLVFNAKQTENTTVTVNHTQINNEAGATEEIKVEFAHANTEVIGAVPATCTNAGYTGDTYCTDCGKLLEKGMIIEALPHEFGEWTVTKEATCTEAGELTRTCACGLTETQPIAATGHSFGEWVVTKEATCTEAGELTRTCVCGLTETQPIPATGHSFGEWVVTKEATCTEHGELTRTCVCGLTETQVIPATGHTFGEWVVIKEATCTEHGEITRTCACGHVEGSITPALGHVYTTEVVAPTCTDYGYTVYTCSVCGESHISDLVAPDCGTAGYTDVPVNAWYHEAVDYVVENGLMNGVTKTAFAPEAIMNRAQMVTILYRMAGSPDVDAPAAFADVAADSFYADAVAWAVANGITTGVSSNAFDPNGQITREQMVTFLYRYAKLGGMDVTTSGSLDAYADAAEVSSWAVEAMTWAVEKGIISGVNATTLAPASVTNRAEVATVLMRFAK